jgi:hypothetical protein
VARKKADDAPPPVVWLELDLGDTAVVVREWPDKMFTLDLDDTRLVATADQMREIVEPLVALAKEKGWT